MQTHRTKVAMPPAQAGFNYEVEPNLVERLPADAVVEPAQRDGGLVILAPK